MNESDDKLCALLSQWREIEPQADFEANVWRQIRLAQAEVVERASLAELLRRALWQPAMSGAVAVMIAVIVGSSAGVFSASRPTRAARADFGFLSTGTLAGGYLKLTSQGGR